MTTLPAIDIDYDKLLDSPTQKRVREMVVPEPDEEPAAEDRKEAGRRCPGNPDDSPEGVNYAQHWLCMS